jgi:putative transposase
MVDHVHLCLSIPPKYSVATAVGRMKGKSAIRIHRACLGRAQHVTGFHVWAKGYGVSTVGFDEQQVLEYIREQEAHEKTEEQLTLLLTHKQPK